MAFWGWYFVFLLNGPCPQVYTPSGWTTCQYCACTEEINTLSGTDRTLSTLVRTEMWSYSAQHEDRHASKTLEENYVFIPELISKSVNTRTSRSFQFSDLFTVNLSFVLVNMWLRLMWEHWGQRVGVASHWSHLIGRFYSFVSISVSCPIIKVQYLWSRK